MKQTLLIIVLFLCSLGSTSLMAQIRKSDQQLMNEAYSLQEKEIKVANMKYERGTSTTPTLYSIERGKDETKVTFLQPIYWDSQWLYFSPGFTIVDRRSGDRYKARAFEGGIPLRLLKIKGYNNQYIFVTLVFPKLKKKVKYIDILELPMPGDEFALPSNDNGVNKMYHNIKIDDYLVCTKKNYKVYN